MSRIARRIQRVNPTVQPSGGFIPNLINNPRIGGYPDASNTGVPTGTVLTSSGSMNISTDGTIIQNLNISGMIFVRANNVTIRNCRITSGDYYPIDWDGGTHTGLLVEDTEIIGLSHTVTAGMSFSNYTARRVETYGCADGFKADADVLIEDCYVHDLAVNEQAGTHNDGIQTTGGSNVTVRHNTLKFGSGSGVSAVIQFGTEWSINSNWLVENNLIDGGGWSLNASSDPADSVNFQILNNRFTRNAAYGPGGIPGSTWTGNIYDDIGAVVPG